MGLLPRIRIGRLKFRRTKLRRWIRRVPVTSYLLAIEVLAYTLLLIFISTGERAARLKSMGEHADVASSLLLVLVFVAFHTNNLPRQFSRLLRPVCGVIGRSA